MSSTTIQSSTEGLKLGSYLTIIKGVTEQGKKFRPSDWVDRLLGVSSFYAREYHGNPKDISSSVFAVNRDGVKSILFDSMLEEKASDLCTFLHTFAKDNNLAIEILDSSEWNKNRKRIVNKPKRRFI